MNMKHPVVESIEEILAGEIMDDAVTVMQLSAQAIRFLYESLSQVNVFSMTEEEVDTYNEIIGYLQYLHNKHVVDNWSDSEDVAP